MSYQLKKTMQVRTRFAPSPTGYLHVGGARTALFNWLYAKKNSGKMILRIEDTDRVRSNSASILGILEDLLWLGIDWDEGPDIDAVRFNSLKDKGNFTPYYQSKRVDIYSHYINKLLDKGLAYYWWETPDSLSPIKNTHTNQVPFITNKKEALRFCNGKPLAVRFKMPDKKICVNDKILGNTEFPAGIIDDFIIQKSDGTPTYHLAVVVDDELMKISHVIRAQEHFSNSPKHIAIQKALDFQVPVYAHIPLVLDQNGSKLSKRAKDRVFRTEVNKWLSKNINDINRLGKELLPLCENKYISPKNINKKISSWISKKDSVLTERSLRDSMVKYFNIPINKIPEIDVFDFRKNGYLPEVLLNYLALLGWQTGNNKEKFEIDEMISLFDLSKISKTNSRFDRKKLISFNTQKINELNTQSPSNINKLVDSFNKYIQVNEESVFLNMNVDTNKAEQLIHANKGMRVLSDIDIKCRGLLTPIDNIQYDPIAIRKAFNSLELKTIIKIFKEISSVLEKKIEWKATDIEKIITDYSEKIELPSTTIIPLLRVAISGGLVSPSIGNSFEILGKAESLKRISHFKFLFCNETTYNK